MKISMTKAFLCLMLPLSLAAEDKLQQGRKLYETNCMACHGKNLEGAVGQPLKDAAWIHGSTPQQIEHSIRKGFMQKGMPAFETMLKADQITLLRDYILSEQQGLRELSVKTYAWNGKKLPDFGKLPAAKAVQIPGNQVTLSPLKGKKSGALLFEGMLDINRPGKYRLRLASDDGVRLLINGKKVLEDDGLHPARRRTSAPIEFKAGAHKFELQYFDLGGNRALELELIDMEKNYIPLDANKRKKIVPATPLLLKKEARVRVSRHLLKSMSSHSLHVSLPSGLNFSIDPQQLSLAHFWKGDFLNLRAELTGRGQKPSLPMSKKLPSPLKLLQAAHGAKLKLKAFEIQQDKLLLEFDCEGKSTKILLTSKDGKTLQMQVQSEAKLKVEVATGGNMLLEGKLLQAGTHLLSKQENNFEIIPGEAK